MKQPRQNLQRNKQHVNPNGEPSTKSKSGIHFAAKRRLEAKAKWPTYVFGQKYEGANLKVSRGRDPSTPWRGAQGSRAHMAGNPIEHDKEPCTPADMDNTVILSSNQTKPKRQSIRNRELETRASKSVRLSKTHLSKPSQPGYDCSKQHFTERHRRLTQWSSNENTIINRIRARGCDGKISPNRTITAAFENSNPKNFHVSGKERQFVKMHCEGVWFDGVPQALIAASRDDQSATTKSLVKASSFSGPTRRIAIDCEFVGVGYLGKENALARVSIVNQFGHVLLDRLVLPKERVTDYRTKYSGIRAADLKSGGPARPFSEVHQEVAQLLKGRVLIGHSVGNDLKVLMLSHPRRDIRDTSHYRPFRDLFGGRVPSLRNLTEKLLGVQVQTGEHDSVEDARAAMRLYTSVKKVWESKGKLRKPLCLSAPCSRNPPDDTRRKFSGTGDAANSQSIDLLSEFQSGLESVGPPTAEPCRPQSAWKQKAWDGSRSRRCSVKRARFLKRRAKLSSA